MKFWFCEKCNTRLTDDDLGAGRATEMGSQAVYCAACLKAMNAAIAPTGEHRAARSTVVLAARRPSASTARTPTRPAAESSANTTIYLIGGGVLVVFVLGLLLLGGHRSETSESVAVAEHVEKAPSTNAPVNKVVTTQAPSPAVTKPQAESEKRPEKPQASGLFSITFGGDSGGGSKTPPPVTSAPPKNPGVPLPEISKPAARAEPVENLDALLKRAVQLEASGKFDEALAAYDKAAKMSPDYPEIYSNRGNVRLNMRDFRNALADADLALQKKKFWNAWAVRAIALAMLGQETEYRAALDEALSLVAQKKELEEIIVASVNKLKIQNAGKELEGKQPKTTQEYIARAQFRINQKRWRDALTDYDAALNLDKSLGEKGVYAAMAELAGQDGDHKGKLDYYQRWLNAAPTSAEAMNSVAWELLTSKDEKLRDPAAALPLAEKANAATQEQNPGILDTLALALHRTGKKTDAINMQKKALALLPNTTPAATRQEFEQHLREFQN